MERVTNIMNFIKWSPYYYISYVQGRKSTDGCNVARKYLVDICM